MRHKKGAFEQINALMIAFVGFVLIVVLIMTMLSIFKTTSLVCTSDTNASAASYGGRCSLCAMNISQSYVLCGQGTTSMTCCNSSNYALNNTALLSEYGGAAYNATKQLTDAALLPPQFASLIVIVVIIVGILAMLGMLGYGVYQRMKQ